MLLSSFTLEVKFNNKLITYKMRFCSIIITLQDLILCLRHRGDSRQCYLLGIGPDEKKGSAMYSGLNRDICKSAWDICRPALVASAQRSITNKLAGTIVVLSPITGELLFSESVNTTHPDKKKYDEIALAKAQVSWATGLTSRQVQQYAPHLYQPGMTKWGGAVIENKLVVAFNGVQAVFDEAIAWMVLNWVLAICQNEMTKPGGVMASGSSFIDGT